MKDARIREEAKAAFLARRREGLGARVVEREPVTRAELEALERNRSVPVLAPHLRPGGALECEVNADVERVKEQRIRRIEARLGQAQPVGRAFRERSYER